MQSTVLKHFNILKQVYYTMYIIHIALFRLIPLLLSHIITFHTFIIIIIIIIILIIIILRLSLYHISSLPPVHLPYYLHRHPSNGQLHHYHLFTYKNFYLHRHPMVNSLIARSLMWEPLSRASLQQDIMPVHYWKTPLVSKLIPSLLD
jgi:hypothetical protein